jgi:hypothetical protein
VRHFARIACVLILLAACGGAAAPDPLYKKASDAVATKSLKSLVPQIDQQLEPLLIMLNPGDFDRLTELAALREFAKYFGRLENLDEQIDQIPTLQWLVTQPQLLKTLMMAVSDQDAPDQVLHVLVALRADQKERLEEFPDLAAAMCVVWDAPWNQANAALGPATPDPDPRNDLVQPRMLMRYYMASRGQLRFDPKTLPWQLSAYVVDNVAGLPELQWAQQRFAKRGAVGAVFFDVPYDYARYTGEADAKMKDRSYTLQNLMLYGGICGDQAYFAAHVARALGVPATICTGHGATEGTGHAWIGYLDVRGEHASWNFTEGRYPENQYWQGKVIDPQTREGITDADVSLLAELQYSNPHDRLTSDALCKVADLLGDPKKPELYMQAIKLSSGNPRAWHALAKLAADLKLDPQDATRLRSAIEKFAVKRYPDFALNLLMTSVSGRGSDQQIKALEDMRPMFSNRPDLLAKIRMAQGDRYRVDKRLDEAIAVYGDVLDRYLNIGPIVLEAMDHVDQMLHEAGALPRLAAIYRTVWQRMPQPEASIVVGGTPFYRVGANYRDVLNEMGQANAAATVQSRLDALSSTTAGHR